MLLKSLPDLRDKKVQSKLTLCKKPTPSWNSYFSQYNNVLQALINIGFLYKHTYFREFAMPFLFIFRHTIELQLKRGLNLNNKDTSIPHNHNLDEEYYKKILPKDFYCNLDALNLKGDGSCFRYVVDKNSQAYFTKYKVLDIYSLVKYYTSCNFNSLVMPKVRFSEEEKIKSMFEYPTNLCQNIGVLRTQYDYCLTLLVNSINENKVNIDDIIIPLYFLLRHGLELGLKCSISAINKEIPNHYFKKLEKNVLDSIKTALNNVDKKDKIYKDLICDKENLSKLVDLIESKDKFSEVFRYPVNRANKFVTLSLSDKSFLKDLALYRKCDNFLSCALLYLKEENLI